MSVLLERARVWRRQRLTRELCEGAGRILCPSLAALTAALWLDKLILLPQSARVAAWLAGAAGGIFGAYTWLWRPWRRNLWPVVLRGVAQEFPELRAYIEPAWELHEAVPAHTSRQLAQAHALATEKLLAAFPARPAFRWRPSERLRQAAAAVLLGLLTWPWLGEASWERVLAPWRDFALERFVLVQPGDVSWSLGQPAVIAARLSGTAGGPRRVEETRLWLKTSGSWSDVAWERQTPEGVAFTVSTVAEPLRYRLTWRGLKSRAYRIAPEAVPQLESLQARLAGQAPVPLNGAEPLAARQGTWVTVSGRPNQPLAQALLRATFLPAPLPFKCARAGDCTAGFFAQQDGTFQFDLETADGRRNPAPVVYALKAFADQPPLAELLSPLQPVQASPASILPVAYSTRDDSALTSVALRIQVPGQAARETFLQRFGRRPPREFIGDYPWPLAGLPVGAKVIFWIKAYDDSVPPQGGISQPGSVEIVDFEAGHLAAQQTWRKAEELLGGVAAREERLRDRYGAGDVAGARRELPGLPEAWQRSLAAMEDLTRSMDADVYANPGLREEFSRLADGLRQTQGRELPAALDADRGSNAAAAGSRHGHLAEAARRAQRLLAQGRPLQDLQDFYMQAGRMSQDGERLASALESLSGARKGEAPAEAMRRIQETLKSLQESMAALQRAITALPQTQAGAAQEQSRRSYTMPLLEAQTSADALQAALRAGDYAMAASIAKELARQLAAMEAAVTAAASASASAPQRQAAARMQRLQKLWSEAVENQSRLVDASQGFEDRRRQSFLAEQKSLLAELAAEESVLLSSATAAEAPAGALSAMRSLRDEFSSARVRQAPALVETAVAVLRGAARRPTPKPGRAEAMQQLAAAQEDIGRRLARFPAAPAPEGPRAETASAAKRQGEVRDQTAGLERELQSWAEDTGAALPELAPKLDAAQDEQKGAEADLSRGDSSGALAHQEKALEFLQQGGQELARSAAAQKDIEIGINGGFTQPASGVRSASGTGGMGVRSEFVPLPTAKDYLPPKELREELERSLREKRPAAYDGVIKEYFKRISQ